LYLLFTNQSISKSVLRNRMQKDKAVIPSCARLRGALICSEYQISTAHRYIDRERSCESSAQAATRLPRSNGSMRYSSLAHAASASHNNYTEEVVDSAGSVPRLYTRATLLGASSNSAARLRDGLSQETLSRCNFGTRGSIVIRGSGPWIPRRWHSTNHPNNNSIKVSEAVSTSCEEGL
jgi:hypothetical protein